MTPHERTQEALRALEWFAKLEAKEADSRHREAMDIAERVLAELKAHREHTLYALASKNPGKAILLILLCMVWGSGLLPSALPALIPLLPQMIGAATHGTVP